MRYSASDKTEIIRLVEQSPLPARRTLDKLGVPRSSFYRWYDRNQRGGREALADRPSRSDRVWNRGFRHANSNVYSPDPPPPGLYGGGVISMSVTALGRSPSGR